MQKREKLVQKEYIAVIQDRGQITLPAGIRKLSGLKVRDRVRIDYNGKDITIEPVKRSIRNHFGKFGKLPEGVTFKDAIIDAHGERGKKYHT